MGLYIVVKIQFKNEGEICTIKTKIDLSIIAASLKVFLSDELQEKENDPKGM